MKRKHRIVALCILLAVLVCVSGLLCFTHVIRKTHYEDVRLHRVTLMLRAYILDTRGAFPASPDSLVEKGYLRRLESEDMFEIPGKDDETVGAGTFYGTPVPIPGRDIRRIRFGAALDKLTLAGDRLMDPSTGEEALLVQFESLGKIDLECSRARTKELFLFAQKIRKEASSKPAEAPGQSWVE